MVRDHVYINGLRVMVLIGVLPHEREAPQPIQIDVDVEVDLARAGMSDDLHDTVNYGAMCDAIAQLARASSDLLLERLAQRVAECALGFVGVEVAHVTITKLHPPIDEQLDSTAIKITRTQVDVKNKVELGGLDGDQHTAVIALGSNLGDRVAHLSFAISQMHLLGQLQAQSSVYETDPVGGPDNQGPYLNMAVVLITRLDPYALLRQLHAIESAAHRERIERWGPRTLDLDVIFYDDIAIVDQNLTIPHPRWSERRFVLAPLADVAPDRCPSNWKESAPAGEVYNRGALSSLV
jgi:dihydroneopterin aldolase / 2-amino-4-hydroxy-6-hydroxymethyldihydropteridine diphosphokinase